MNHSIQSTGVTMSPQVYRSFKTDYLAAMTRIYRKTEKAMGKLRDKYRLTEEQMENLIKTMKP